MIDVKNGGSVKGEIKALNDILNRTVYEHEEEGGTLRHSRPRFPARRARGASSIATWW